MPRNAQEANKLEDVGNSQGQVQSSNEISKGIPSERLLSRVNRLRNRSRAKGLESKASLTAEKVEREELVCPGKLSSLLALPAEVHLTEVTLLKLL